MLRNLDVLVWVVAIALGPLVRYGVRPPARTTAGTAILVGLAASLVIAVATRPASIAADT